MSRIKKVIYPIIVSLGIGNAAIAQGVETTNPPPTLKANPEGFTETGVTAFLECVVDNVLTGVPSLETSAFELVVTNMSQRNSKTDGGAWRYWYNYRLIDGTGEAIHNFKSDRTGSPSQYQSLDQQHRLLQEVFLEEKVKVGDYYWTGDVGTEWRRNSFESGGSNTYRLMVQHMETDQLSVMICTYRWASFGSSR